MTITLSGGPLSGQEVEVTGTSGEVVEVAGADEWGNATIFLYRVDVHPKSHQISAVFTGEKE